MGQLETRAAVKARLQGEGRWKEALAYRDSLKEQGVVPAEAYRRMVEAFPSLANGQAASTNAVPESEPPPVKRRRRKGKCGRFDLPRDTAWAYLNFDQDPDTLVAPNAGARELLRWARADPSSFFKTFLPRMLPKGGLDDDLPPDEQDDGRDLLAEIMERYRSKPEPEADGPAHRAPPC
jgi:hypothetical protein